MNRLAQFLRSVLPSDLTQLVFLFGVVLLFVGSRLSWLPLEIIDATRSFSAWQKQLSAGNFGRVIAISSFGVTFAGLAGYFVCFWPGRSALRRVLVAVCLPALASLALILGWILYLNAPYKSVLERASGTSAGIGWTPSLFWKLPQGFRFSCLGVLLVLTFVSRMAFGISTLPLSLQGIRNPDLDNPPYWKRMRILIYMLIGPHYLIGNVLFFILFLFPLPFHTTFWFGGLHSLLSAVLFLCIALLIVGKIGVEAARHSWRWPPLRYAFLALVIPLAVSAAFPIGEYLFDRAYWAANEFGRFAPPLLISYFQLPSLSLVLMVFGVIGEESIFRGVLQPFLIGRYDLYRGIFLTGIIWSALHFHSDAGAQLPDTGVFLHLATRTLMCVAHSYIFAWLTLRSGSILPAVIIHFFYNVFALTSLGRPFLGRSPLAMAVWIAVAFLLFHFWPLDEARSPQPDVSVADPQPAV